MKVVFLDATCPKPYDNAVLRSGGLGGTEATVIRIATALSEDHDITVCQHNRREATTESPTLRFETMTAADTRVTNADHVVFVTKAQDLARFAACTKGRLWLWLHNYLIDEIPFHWRDHLLHRLGIVCVSATHAEHTRRSIRRHPADRLTVGRLARAGVVHHYNPIDAALAPDETVARDRDKLVFFSSPHKGLEQVLARFGDAYAARPTLRLYVADPGYSRASRAAGVDHPAIVHLGSLSHAELSRHVREALCVFYPQHQRAETFGLVYAESNAVGTPVLAHDFGSAREVLAPSNAPFDARSPSAVLSRLLQWIDHGTPIVGPDPRFEIGRVAEGWRRFFADPNGYAAALAREDHGRSR